MIAYLRRRIRLRFFRKALFAARTKRIKARARRLLAELEAEYVNTPDYRHARLLLPNIWQLHRIINADFIE